MTKNTRNKSAIQSMLKFMAALTLSLLIGLIFFAGSVASEMDCAKISHWSATNPPVNQQHVFCGEWKKRKNRPAGFHSRPAGENPATVGALKITQQPNDKGLYGVRWSYAGHPDREKILIHVPGHLQPRANSKIHSLCRKEPAILPGRRAPLGQMCHRPVW